MDGINWAEELGVAITVSDSSGKIVYMNGKSASTFGKEGGKSLVGSSLMTATNLNHGKNPADTRTGKPTATLSKKTE
jgi:transcriptional regulator with PAS, ATPase and Fis domain